MDRKNHKLRLRLRHLLLRRTRVQRGCQRGMTLLEIMIVLAILALVMGFLVGPKIYNAFQDSREDTQRAVLKQYAYEAYPRWQSRHPSTGCPSALSELSEYMNKTETKDVWGKELIMLCGDNMPAGVKGGFGVMSLGADGQQGTTDDIKSWD